jgi:hypothetical protein
LKFFIKSYQKFQNTPVLFYFLKKIIKIFKDSGIDIFANFIKLLPTPKSLKKFLLFLKKIGALDITIDAF